MQAQRTKAKRNGFKSAVIALMILAVLTCAGFLGYKIFKVQRIVVSGNRLFASEEVIALSGIQKGDNLFAVRESTVKKGVEAEPYLTLVKMERRWPSTIALTVTEREAVAAVAYDGQYLIVGDDGTVLRMQSDPQDYIIANGMGVTAAAKGAKMQGPTTYQIHVMSLLSSQIRSSTCKASIEHMDIRDPASIVLYARCGIAIRLGTEENLAQKFVWIQTLLPRLEAEGKRYGTLDVSGSTGASYNP